ncbi:MAG: RDD family protein [Bacillota bacterium]|nr:RDD family protein [Bacillota bacterium]
MAEKREVKDCPYCGEEILAKAIRCKHCRSDLEPMEPKAAETPQQTLIPATPPPVPDMPSDPTPPPVTPPPSPVQPAAPTPPPVTPEMTAPEPPAASPPTLSQGSIPTPPPAQGESQSSGSGGVTPPAGPVQGSGGLYEYPKANIGKRILAYIIDALIGGLPIAILTPIALIPVFRHASTYSYYGDYYSVGPNIGLIIFAVIASVIGGGWALFYFLFRDGFANGQSWGKKISGLMVVNLEDNNPCTKGKSFVRNVFAWIIAIVLGWIPVLNFLAGIAEPVIALIHARGHRVGDMVAKTQVIDLEHYSK